MAKTSLNERNWFDCPLTLGLAERGNDGFDPVLLPPLPQHLAGFRIGDA